jgi:quercetin dioxygenase-like cupin family protein
MKHLAYTSASTKTFNAPAKGVSGRVLLGKADGAENYCMRMIEIAPGGMVPLHSHPWEHEQFVHSGRGTLVCAGESVDFAPGDAMFVPGGAEHQITNTGAEPVLLICLVPPSAPEI